MSLTIENKQREDIIYPIIFTQFQLNAIIIKFISKNLCISMLEVAMKEMIICSIVGIIQIFLSINLIVRRKNIIAIISEILSSLILLFALSDFSINVSDISCQNIALTVLEYLTVKVFLIIFMTIARIYSFYAIKAVARKRKKIGKKRLKLISKFNKARYWPKLKLGIPGQAGKTHVVTRVKFDEKGFPKFKSYYTVKLRRRNYRKTRAQHFYIANKMLYKNVCSSSRVRAKFTKSQIKAMSQGETPNGYTWHHHQDAGVLQLVDEDIHSKTKHDGGYSIWGGKE